MIRKVFVCFFQEPEHVEQAPIERVAFDVRAHDDDEVSLEPLRLQVCTRPAVSVIPFWFLSSVLELLRQDSRPSLASPFSLRRSLASQGRRTVLVMERQQLCRSRRSRQIRRARRRVPTATPLPKPIG